LHNAKPLKPGVQITDKLVRRYFAKNEYPYDERLSLKSYYQQKQGLQIELVKLQNWVKDTGGKIVIVFEGRDAAGKGSTIRKLTERLEPRGFEIHRVRQPRSYERDMPWLWRYWRMVPAYGSIADVDGNDIVAVDEVLGVLANWSQ